MDKCYLITLRDHPNAIPNNHGLVNIDDQERINGRIPLKDFGMFYMRQDKPFPTDSKGMLEIFTLLLTEREN